MNLHVHFSRRSKKFLNGLTFGTMWISVFPNKYRMWPKTNFRFKKCLGELVRAQDDLIPCTLLIQGYTIMRSFSNLPNVHSTKVRWLIALVADGQNGWANNYPTFGNNLFASNCGILATQPVYHLFSNKKSDLNGNLIAQVWLGRKSSLSSFFFVRLLAVHLKKFGFKAPFATDLDKQVTEGNKRTSNQKNSFFHQWFFDSFFLEMFMTCQQCGIIL